MRLVLILAALLCAPGIIAYAEIQQDVVERDTIGGTGSGGGGDLSAIDIDTFSELDAIVADEGLVNLNDAQTLMNKVIDGNSNTVKMLRHASDCTAYTGAVDGQYCWEQDDDILYVCETADECDTGGEWAAVASGGGAVDSVFGRTGAITAATSDYDAAQIDNTPAGNIAATNVQAAIDELDAEKLGASQASSTYMTLTGGVFTGKITQNVQSLTIADSGNGSPATDSATTITGNIIRVTCSDADGCNLTLSESSALNGQRIKIENVSANPVTLVYSAGVAETCDAADYSLDTAGKSVGFEYVTNVWKQDCQTAIAFQTTPSGCDAGEKSEGIGIDGDAICSSVLGTDISFDGVGNDYSAADNIQEALIEITNAPAGGPNDADSIIPWENLTGIPEFSVPSGTNPTVDGSPVNLAIDTDDEVVKFWDGDEVQTLTPGAGGGSITVEESDDNPTVSSVNTIQFNASHFSVADETGGQVQVNSIKTPLADAINAGSNPTVDSTSNVAVDTTAPQLLWYTGAAVAAMPLTQTMCKVIENVKAADDNILLYMWGQAVTITGIGCTYAGSAPTTPATFTLEDGNGNGMTITGTNPTCVAPASNAAFAAVTASNTLASGEPLRFDVTNTPNPVTDTYMVCITFTYDRL